MPLRRRPVMYEDDSDSSSEEDPSPPPTPRPMPASKKREFAAKANLSQSVSQLSLSQSNSQAVRQSSQGVAEDYAPTQCTQRDLGASELNRLAFLVSNFFLCAESKKIPVKRADITKIIPREYSRRTATIIDAASERLEKVFGYKIHELEKRGYYVMTNCFEKHLLDQNGESLVKFSPKESAINGLRTIILACIFMNGGVMHEASLQQFLTKFEMDPESKEKHPVFGNVNKLIYQDFERQCYLEVRVNKNVEPAYKEIRWGERAKLEVNKKELLNFVCKVYGKKIKPEMWQEQWNIIEEESKRTSSQMS